MHKWAWFKAEGSRHSKRGAKSLGRREAGKKNSGRGRSWLEQVAFKLGLERWVGFQEADVGWGRGRPEQRAGRTQKNTMLGQGKGVGLALQSGLEDMCMQWGEERFFPQCPRVSIWWQCSVSREVSEICILRMLIWNDILLHAYLFCVQTYRYAHAIAFVWGSEDKLGTQFFLSTVCFPGIELKLSAFPTDSPCFLYICYWMLFILLCSAILLLTFWDEVSLCNSGCPGISQVAWAGLKLKVLTLYLPNAGDYRHVHPARALAS